MQRWWMTRRTIYVLTVLIFVGVAVGWYVLANRNTTNPSFRRRTVDGGLYSFAYPATWKDISRTQSPVSTIAYVVSGVQYDLIVSPPGQLNPEGTPNTTWTSTRVTLGGRPYLRLIWKTQGQPFYMTALPQVSDTTYYEVAMQLPPTNTAYYETTFDQIVASLRY